MNHPISFVAPVVGELDIERLELIQLYLFDYFQTKVPIYIIYKKSEKSLLEKVKNIYTKLDVRLIQEDEVSKNINDIRGWRYQQILKLTIANMVETDWYITMDADCFLCKPLSIEKIIINGQGGTSYMSYKILPETWESDVNQIIPFPKTDKLIGVTPQTMHTKTVSELVEEVTENKLYNTKFTEYLLYWAYINSKNYDLHFEIPNYSSGIWNKEGLQLFQELDEKKIKNRIKNIFNDNLFGLIQSRAVDRPSLHLISKVMREILN